MSSTQQKFSIHTRPNWAEVALPVLERNYRAVAAHVGPKVTVCSVIKCDAYGHGVVECARALERAGSHWLGVTSTEEGLAVRDAGVRARILVMTGIWRNEEDAVIRHNLTPAIATPGHLRALETAAKALGRPQHSLAVHLKLDTGMSRLGLPLEELPDFLERLKQSPYVMLEGVFSHLASSEVLDAPDAEEQMARFDQAMETIHAAGLQPRYTHLANAGAVEARPATWREMVRPGLLLYGYNLPCSGPGAEKTGLDVHPVLSWKTRIIALRDIPAGRAVGYNLTWTAKRSTRVAVLPVGYGDGYNRHLSNRGRVIVRDRYAPIVGNISMDLTTVDVTEIPGAALGDEVLLIGQSANCQVGAQEHADLAGTVIYEILCGLSPRVPRIYVE